MWAHDGGMPWPQVSDAALNVWIAAREREGRAVRRHPECEQLITIDGTPQPFLTLSTPNGRWVAVRRRDGLTITVAGHDVDPTTITFEPIPDPAACSSSARSPRIRKPQGPEMSGDGSRTQENVSRASRPQLLDGPRQFRVRRGC